MSQNKLSYEHQLKVALKFAQRDVKSIQLDFDGDESYATIRFTLDDNDLEAISNISINAIRSFNEGIA